MGIYRVSEQAEAELDGIWLYIAQDTSIDTANHLIDSITARFVIDSRSDLTAIFSFIEEAMTQ